ncbi:F-box-like domain-containing protein [Ceratobasidium sp. AG-Ba]|nr:F-box-like domain-containing protein [Ceratobasidium sp. AG-Ba]
MPLSLSDVLERWKSAHYGLSGLIHEYTNACTAHERSLQESKPDYDTVSYLNNLLPSLSKHEDTLRNARLGLAIKTRHLSNAIAPIQKLHPELQIYIFTLATREWISVDFEDLGDKPVSVTLLTSVCSSWRRLLLRSPRFWSNIQIILTGPSSKKSYQRAAAWVERAQSAPLWLTIIDAIVDEHDITRKPSKQNLSRSFIKTMTDFCTPIIPSVQALSFYINDCMPAPVVYPLLVGWTRYGSPDVAERLKVHIDFDIPGLKIPVIFPGVGDSDFPPKDGLPFFKSLRGIYLQHVIVDLSRVPYSGLTDLHIRFPDQNEGFPTADDLARLLNRNPGLRSLALENLFLAPGGPAPPPVALDQLERLKLDIQQNRDLGRVLSLIYSSSPAIRMVMYMADGNDLECVSAARAFFSRTQVTVLFFDGISGLASDNTRDKSPLAALFTNMPRLHTLTLQACNVSIPVLDQFSQWRGSRDGLKDPWPALRKLNLLQCRTTPGIARRIVQGLKLQTLGIFEPLGWKFSPYRSAEWGEPNVRAGVEQELMGNGVKLVWYLTSHLPNRPAWTLVE